MQHERIAAIQKISADPERVWNVCVIAHVDHGKTSLTDSLLVSNGIISPGMAGQLRYLDSREDEQEREITMKSSSVSLLCEQGLVNLIDSPGHIDFAFEVGAGLKICDGAVVVIDAVEGVQSQTVSLLQRAIDQGVKCVLFVNKVDKLFSKYSPEEVEEQLVSTVSLANAAVNSLLRAKAAAMVQKNPELDEEQVLNELHAEEHFNPTKNNVAFGSVIDGFAFDLGFFAQQLAKKINEDPAEALQNLWGYRFYDPKNKVFSNEPRGNQKTILCQFVLGSICKIYSAVRDADREVLEKVLSSLSIPLKLEPRHFSKEGKAKLLSNIMNLWLPIDKAIYKLICGNLPSVSHAQKLRIHNLLLSDPSLDAPLVEAVKQASPEAPPVVLIPKFFWLPGAAVGRDKERWAFIGLSRIFCGTLSIGQTVTIRSVNEEECQVKAEGLFLLQGSRLMKTDIVQPGSIFGFYSSELKIFKTALICESPTLKMLEPISSKGLIDVRISAEKLHEGKKFIDGLNILHRVDTICQVSHNERGDIILSVNGEVHLEKLIRDLEKDFAGVKVKVLGLIVQFKETIDRASVTISKKEKVEEPEPEDQQDEEERDERDKKGKFAKKTAVKWNSKNVAKSDPKKKDPKAKINPSNSDAQTPTPLGQESQKTGGQTPVSQVRDSKPRSQAKTPHSARPTTPLNEGKSPIKEMAQQPSAENHETNSPIKEIKEQDESPDLNQNEGAEKINEKNDHAKEEQVFIENGEQNHQDESAEVKKNPDPSQEVTEVKEETEKKVEEEEEDSFHFSDLDSQKAEEELQKESEESEDENRVIIEDDNRFQYKKTEFVWKNIKTTVKDVIKRGRILKVKKFDLIENVKMSRNYAVVQTPNRRAEVACQTVRLPEEATQFLLSKEDFMKEAFLLEKKSHREIKIFFDEFFEVCSKTCESNLLVLLKKGLSAFGPNNCGPNVLLNFSESLESTLPVKFNCPPAMTESEERRFKLLTKTLKIHPLANARSASIKNEILSGFSFGSLNGPLCEENLYGCILILESIKFFAEDETVSEETTELLLEDLQLLQLLRTVKEAFHLSLQGSQPKMVQSLFDVKAFCDDNSQGQFCDIIKKHNGRIESIEYQDEMFVSEVLAKLPIHESFGFHGEVLRATSGRVLPQLTFGGWEVIPQNPFYEETLTKEMQDEIGAEVKIRNYAKDIVREVRKRKGLQLDNKIVESGDKQANLSRTR